jgi:hypothetical protein
LEINSEWYPTYDIDQKIVVGSYRSGAVYNNYKGYVAAFSIGQSGKDMSFDDLLGDLYPYMDDVFECSNREYWDDTDNECYEC